MKITEQELQAAIRQLMEEGLIVISGYNEKGEAMYVTKEQAEERKIDIKNNFN